MASQSGDWQAIAEQASKEMDSRKLSSLIAQLCHALDERSPRQLQKAEG